MVQELQFWVRRYRGALVCRLWAALDESCWLCCLDVDSQCNL